MKLRNTLGSLFNKVFTYDKWNIGYVNQTPDDFIQSQKLNSAINWLQESKAEYAADPFAVQINGHLYLYYEELNFLKGRGEIMMADGLHFKNTKKVTGINTPVHLSYPYVFTEKDKTYCIPEMADAKEVSLYHIDKCNPQNFKKVQVLIYGAFVDSSIIFYNNKYWLFTSKRGTKGELYIFYADTLLSDFKPHALNPIGVQVHASRCAGSLFVVAEKLYMPSQNPEKCYGGSIMVNEITHITETEFNYRTVFGLQPQLPYNRGIHTINFVGGLLIVDGKRRVLSMLTPFKKLIRKIKNNAKAVQ